MIVAKRTLGIALSGAGVTAADRSVPGKQAPQSVAIPSLSLSKWPDHAGTLMKIRAGDDAQAYDACAG
jgi:hypothetical protein